VNCRKELLEHRLSGESCAARQQDVHPVQQAELALICHLSPGRAEMR